MLYSSRRGNRLSITTIIGALLLCAGIARGQDAPKLPYTAHTVPGGGGLTLAVEERGNPNGPPILFIHGFSQSRMSWRMQLEDAALLKKFRLVAMDMRGHGRSAKPLGAENYTDPKLWADDVQAVIRTLKLNKPVLVGWSYGGLVMSNYISVHGEGAIAGTVWVGAINRIGGEAANSQFGYAIACCLAGVFSTDFDTELNDVMSFIGLATKVPVRGDALLEFLAINMMTPPEVRLGLVSREENYDALLKTVKKPALIIHGQFDHIVQPSQGEHLVKLMANAEGKSYDGSGHAPFREEPTRFNADLAAFVSAAQ